MDASPQRYLANNRNLLRAVVLDPSSVLPVTNKVVAIPYARKGTAQAIVSGTYTGTEEALYDIEILDTDVEIPRISAPTFSGAGSGTISAIAATGTQQVYTVELADAGTPAGTATVGVEGVTIKARDSGVAGNLIRITVDQSTLSFTPSGYTTIADMTAGQNSFIGQGFDFDNAALAYTNGVGLIPAGAHRVSFGSDTSRVYLMYKDYVDGVWTNYTVPALGADVPRGTVVNFVTGGRSVVVANEMDTETYAAIATAYDLLYALRTQSALVVVDGIVANDRTPTGQASRELTVRTDAHAEVSSGSGGDYAKGFTGVTVDSGAGTQLVTAKCFAVTASDHPLARLGSELWQLDSSLLGKLGVIKTGAAFVGTQFGLTIPVRLPPGYGQDKGSASAAVTYTSRSGAESEPPICVEPVLGPDATNKSLTFTYTGRPVGDCSCGDMPTTNLLTSCLGNPSEGASVSYQDDTVTRLVDLYDWYETLVRTLSEMGTDINSASTTPALTNPVDGSVVTSTRFVLAKNTESIKTVVQNFEAALAMIDVLAEASPAGYRENGNTAWDAAVALFEADINAQVAANSPPEDILSIPSERYEAAIKKVLMTAGITTLGKTDASTVLGDGCWRDWGDSAYWKSEDGYAPAFTNHPYWSSRRSVGGSYFSTHEFAFQINVKCPQYLKAGDKITIVINNAGWGATYQQGDELVLPIAAASPLFLSGGIDGAPTQEWTVAGSVNGGMPSYAFNPDAPVAYDETVGGDSLTFSLATGGVPWAKGDRFRFAVEGGHFRWRKDGGAWNDDSPPLPIPLASTVLDDGLSVEWTTGAAASFVEGDRWPFRATQPWAASNLQRPTLGVWKWDGTGATIEATFDQVETLGMIAFLHTLPEGATVTLEGGIDSDGYAWTESLTWRTGCIWQALDREALYVRITITNATGGSIRWAWLGDPLRTTLSAEIQLRRDYDVRRAPSGLQGGLYKGKALSGEIEWSEGALTEADCTALAEMLDHLKERGDEPLIVIPQITRTADPVLFAHVNADGVDFPDISAYNRAEGIDRRFSARIPLQGVWQ